MSSKGQERAKQNDTPVMQQTHVNGNNHRDQNNNEDDYETRIRKTGCFRENENLQLCYADKHDWR
ncbi:8246_t:CDS:1, partial [Ambispora leptoticha]